jgi:hypothetical protein
LFPLGKDKTSFTQATHPVYFVGEDDRILTHSLPLVVPMHQEIESSSLMQRD